MLERHRHAPLEPSSNRHLPSQKLVRREREHVLVPFWLAAHPNTPWDTDLPCHICQGATQTLQLDWTECNDCTLQLSSPIEGIAQFDLEWEGEALALLAVGLLSRSSAKARCGEDESRLCGLQHLGMCDFARLAHPFQNLLHDFHFVAAQARHHRTTQRAPTSTARRSARLIVHRTRKHPFSFHPRQYCVSVSDTSTGSE
eukprot:745055-Rhodomonas_salina.1